MGQICEKAPHNVHVNQAVCTIDIQTCQPVIVMHIYLISAGKGFWCESMPIQTTIICSSIGTHSCTVSYTLGRSQHIFCC